MVGSNSPQCTAAGYTVAGKYPVNLFNVNPYTNPRTVNDDGFSSYDGLQVAIQAPFRARPEYGRQLYLGQVAHE